MGGLDFSLLRDILKIELIEGWREKLTKLWSMRLMALAMLFGVLELVLPYFSDWIPPRIFGALSLIVTVGAMVARMIYQSKLYGDKKE